MADGWITIGTKLETDKFDKQLNKLDSEIKKQEDKKIIIEAKMSDQETNLEEARKKVDELGEAYQRLKTIQEKASKGKATLEDFNMQTDITSRYGNIEKIGASFDKALDKQIALEQKTEQTKYQYDQINQKIEEYKEKVESVKLNKQVNDANKLKESISGVGGAFQKAVKSAAKLALSIFAVRSAYMALRRASSELATYDDQYSTNLEYIRFALTQAIAPVLRYIVNLAAQLLSYINAIANAWFGLNIFGNASVDDFNKMKKGASGVAGAVQEIKKQLAGFDEMNVLSDNSSAGGGGGDSSAMPEFDLSAIQGDIPEWLQWIIDHGDLVKTIFEGIAAALIAMKLGFSALQGVGIFLIIDGIIGLVDAIQDFANNPSVSNFLDILKGIGEVLVGFSLIAGLTTPLGLILAIVGQLILMVSGIIQWITALIELIQHPSWDNFIKFIRGVISSSGILGVIIDKLLVQFGVFKDETDDLASSTENLTKAQEAAAKAQDTYTNSIDRAEEAQRKLEEAQNRTGLSGEELFNAVKNGTLDYKNMTKEQREVYKAYLDNEQAQKQVKQATDDLMKAKKEETLASLNNQLQLSKESKNYDSYKQSVVNAFKEGKISADEARDLIGKSLQNISKDSRQTFIDDLPGDIKDGLDVKNYRTAGEKMSDWFDGIWNTITAKAGEIGLKVGEAIGNAFKWVVNSLIDWVERQLNKPINAINGLIDIINAIPGINIGYLPNIWLPRLATGGLVNMPNRGVNIGGAIAGESGREGVIPLTDSQAMEQLGEAIGRYITINANITNTMNGRIISKELQKIQNDRNFAYNL